jgi:Putative zinc-finger
MAVTEIPTAQGHCPTDEELAAFIDGMLSPSERSRITAHLADCESCYEIFAGAVHFQQETVSPYQAAAKVVSFPGPRPGGGGSRKRWWLPATAAAVLAVGVGLAGYWTFYQEPKISLADLTTVSPSGPLTAGDYYHGAVYRGGKDNDSLPSVTAPELMVGVLLMDVSLDRRQGNVDPGRLHEIGSKLAETSVFPVESARFLEASRKLRSGDAAARREVAASLPAQEAALDTLLSESPPYNLGKWAEAGRLAARTRNPGFFSRRDNKRFLAKVVKDPLFQEEGVAEHLTAIQEIWERGNLHTDDYKQLADHFTEIIRHYDV